MQIRKLVAPDVFIMNDCLIFDGSRAEKLVDIVPALSCASILASEEGIPSNQEALEQSCTDCATKLLFGYQSPSDDDRLWLLLAHGPWQAKSAMVRNKKLWRSLSSKLPLESFLLSQDVLVESDAGLRFVGVAEVTKDNFLTAVQVMRSEPSSAMILSKRQDIYSEDGIRFLFDSAFSPRDRAIQASVDWLNLALHCSPLGDVVIRVGGSWDEREASLDFIMQKAKLTIFETLFEKIECQPG